MNLDAYFDRIGYDGPREPTRPVLDAIAYRHALAIPFENLSVLSSGAPDLELPAIVDKLVLRRRGGYCYEQNNLLRAALEALGFDVLPLSARVRYGVPPDVITPRSHMVLCVTTSDGRMLVDAGFGGLTLTGTVRIDSRDPQCTPHEVVRLVPEGSDMLLQACVADAWRDVYRFDFVRQLPIDYVQQNWHTATRPGALFAQNLIAARPAPDGRHTLFNRTLTFRDRAGVVIRRTLDDRDTLRETLASVFGVIVTDAEIERAWEVAGRGEVTHPGFS